MMEPEICRACGTPRLSTARSCITCGTKFPRDVRYVRGSQSGGPVREGPLPAPASEPPPERPFRRRGAWVGIGVLLVVFAGIVAAAVVLNDTEARAAYALQFSRAKPGDSYRYRMNMTIDARVGSEDFGLEEPVRGTASIVMSMEVLAVDPLNVATVRVSWEGTATQSGVPQPIEAATLTIDVGPDGRVLSSPKVPFLSHGTELGGDLPGMSQFTPVLPRQAVEPGDRWALTFDVPFPFGGAVRMSTDNVFLKTEPIHGLDAAVIRTESGAPFHFTLNIRDAAQVLGIASTDLPSGADPEMEMDGTTMTVATTWVHLPTGRWFKTLGTNTFDVHVLIRGLPGPGPTEGSFRFAGKIDLSIKSLRQASPAGRG